MTGPDCCGGKLLADGVPAACGRAEPHLPHRLGVRPTSNRPVLLGFGPLYDALPPVPPLLMGVAEYGRRGALR